MAGHYLHSSILLPIAMVAHSLILFNKPYKVLSQFRPDRNATEAQQTLADFIDIPEVYPAGRLDYHSEGLLLLTDSGALQARISQPRFKLEKHYWVQVEGSPTPENIRQLCNGIDLRDGRTRPARVASLPSAPDLWGRYPAVAAHRDASSSWLNIVLTEGRNRQVRRMCAAIGHPVLRLVRHRIGNWLLADLAPGEYRQQEKVNLPQSRKAGS